MDDQEQEMLLDSQPIPRPPEAISQERKRIGFNSASVNRNSSRIASTYSYLESEAGHTTNLDQDTIHDPPNPLFVTAVRELFSGGWRSGCCIFFVVTVAVFFINLIFTIWALSISAIDPHDGVRTISTVSCENASILNTVAHVFINAFSTVLLSASNYTMQCLTSPTRTDINNAHKNERCRDIGVPSVKNLWSIGRFRPAIWGLLWLSSLALHFIYNSVIVVAHTVYPTSLYFMTEGSIQHNTTGFEHVDNVTCIGQLNPGDQFGTRDIVLVVSGNLSALTGIGINLHTFHDSGIARLGDLDAYYQSCLNCSGDLWDSLNQYKSWELYGPPVDDCLVQPGPQQCRLQFGWHLMVVVLLANVVKSVCILCVILRGKDELLMTIGDTIFSFLHEPDETTASKGVVENHNIKCGMWKFTSRGAKSSRRSHKVHWFRAASLTRWISCFILCIAALGTAVVLCLGSLQPHSVGADALFVVTFQRYSEGEISTLWASSENGRPSTLLSCALIANTPQVLLSFLYMLYNSLFTSMLLGKEWDSFSGKWRPLRVTSPLNPPDHSEQTDKCGWTHSFQLLQRLNPARPDDVQGSSHFLQLPYRYSLPLLVVSSLVHWLISQSLFLVRYEEARPSRWLGDPVSSSMAKAFNGVLWSPIHAAIAIVAATTIPVAAVICGLRKYKGDIPLVGSCSIAISGACHPASKHDPVGVQWDEWTSVDGVGRWSLSDTKHIDKDNL